MDTVLGFDPQCGQINQNKAIIAGISADGLVKQLNLLRYIA